MTYFSQSFFMLRRFFPAGIGRGGEGIGGRGGGRLLETDTGERLRIRDFLSTDRVPRNIYPIFIMR